MVGLSDLFWVYQNSGPALLFGMIIGAAYLWKWEIHPWLEDLEQTQEKHADNWDEQSLNSQERTLLIDDTATRVDDVEDALTRLKQRVRDIEQNYAADHGEVVNGIDQLDDPKGGGD